MYEEKVERMRRRCEAYERATLAAGRTPLDRRLLGRLLTLCIGQVHTLALGAVSREQPQQYLPIDLAEAAPRIVSAWGPFLRFLDLGNAAVSAESLRVIFSGCPSLLRLDLHNVEMSASPAPGREVAGASSSSSRRRRAELFSLIEPHATLRSILLPPAPEETWADIPFRRKLKDTVLVSVVRDLCERCPCLREIDASAAFKATPRRLLRWTCSAFCA